MEIRKIKNLIGRCACVDCKEKAAVYISFEVRKKNGKSKIEKSFFLCHDCAADLLVEYNKLPAS